MLKKTLNFPFLNEMEELDRAALKERRVFKLGRAFKEKPVLESFFQKRKIWGSY